MLQLDMTMYTPSGRTPVIGVITDFTNAEENEFIRQLITTYCSIGYQDSRCGYGCSDHASWNKYGYSASFPFETIMGSSNPYIHTANDLITYLTLTHGLEYVKLGLAFATELAFVSCVNP